MSARGRSQETKRQVIGGQAVIEGVMMRSPRDVSVVLRGPKGDLISHTWTSPSLVLARPFFRLPLIRGIVVLYESLVLGSRALMISAGRAESTGGTLTRRQIGFSVVRSLALTFALFFVLPAVIVRAGPGAFHSAFVQNLSEGALRIGLVLAFLYLIGRIPAINSVFQYHGAEHKAVNAFEAGLALDVPSTRTCSRFHPRCGTSFLLIVLFVAIIAFAPLGFRSLAARLLGRMWLLPIVAGASYEILQLGLRFRIFRPILAPGLWLQRLTTREPHDPQLEVAIRALREVASDGAIPSR
jgi:uncharacterized protein YqhQ